MGIWDLTQHGSGSGPTIFDNNVVNINGTEYFSGSNTVALLGEGIATAESNGDHFVSLPDGTLGGMMLSLGIYENARWEIGQVELAVLKDLGYTVIDYSNTILLDTDHVPLI